MLAFVLWQSLVQVRTFYLSVIEHCEHPPGPISTFFTYLSPQKKCSKYTFIRSYTLIRELLVYNLILYDAKDDRLLGILYLSLVGGQAFNLSRLKIIYILNLYVMYMHNGVKQFLQEHSYFHVLFTFIFTNCVKRKHECFFKNNFIPLYIRTFVSTVRFVTNRLHQYLNEGEKIL